MCVKYAFDDGEKIEIGLYQGIDERPQEVGLLSSVMEDGYDNPENKSHTEPVVLINKAAGIPSHVMLLAKMEKIIKSQYMDHKKTLKDQKKIG